MRVFLVPKGKPERVCLFTKKLLFSLSTTKTPRLQLPARPPLLPLHQRRAFVRPSHPPAPSPARARPPRRSAPAPTVHVSPRARPRPRPSPSVFVLTGKRGVVAIVDVRVNVRVRLRCRAVHVSHHVALADWTCASTGDEPGGAVFHVLAFMFCLLPYLPPRFILTCNPRGIRGRRAVS